MVHSLLSLSQINVTTVREHLPKGDFSIMTEMLKKFLSFMNLTVSITAKKHRQSAMLHDDSVEKKQQKKKTQTYRNKLYNFLDSRGIFNPP